MYRLNTTTEGHWEAGRVLEVYYLDCVNGFTGVYKCLGVCVHPNYMSVKLLKNKT